jgi:hypothetical protein
MKIQGNLKNLKKTLKKHNKELDSVLVTLTNNYYSDLVKYQEDLLMNICKDHTLSYEDLHNKYIKSFKKNIKKKKNLNLIEDSDSENDNESDQIRKNTNSLEKKNSDINILEKISIKNKVCYIENKDGGSIYNNEVIKIGEVKSNGDYLLYE